jgi:hypothetical protein
LGRLPDPNKEFSWYSQALLIPEAAPLIAGKFGNRMAYKDPSKQKGPAAMAGPLCRFTPLGQ